MEPICKVKILPIKDDFIYHYDQNGCPLVRICPGQYVTSGDKNNKTLMTCKCPNDMYLDRNKNDCFKSVNSLKNILWRFMRIHRI